MALDATVGGANSNSYVTALEADAYFSDSLMSQQWSAVGSKDAALITATRWLDGFLYEGERASTTQALAHPRKNMYDIEGGLVSSDDIFVNIKRATFELALYMDQNIDSFTEADTTTRIKVAVIEIENELPDFGSYSSLPLVVQRLIDPFLGSPASSGSLSRA